MRKVLLVASSLLCCGQPTRVAGGGGLGAIRACTYDVSELSAEPAELEISAHCLGTGITGFALTQPAAARFVRIVAASAELSRSPTGWRFPAARGETRLQYRVSLESIAREARQFDVALRVGRSLVAPASTFLLQPEPLEPSVPIDLRVRLPKGEDFASALTPTGAAGSRRFRLAAHEVGVASYCIFGHFGRLALKVGGGELEVVTADGALELEPGAIGEWTANAADAVADFYGRFPAGRALVLLVPVKGRDRVVFGKLLPQSAPGIALLVGEHTTQAALNRDWYLVHELFHIGFPSFQEEAKWLDEGSATYFEPIIRARAGHLTELEVWAEFARDMPQGLRAIEQEGLEHPSNYRAIYWGGAIACLLADVAARTRSQGAVGLEVGFRAVLAAGGNATAVWSLAEVTRVIDHALGAPILAKISAEHAQTGAVVGLPALFRKLGVVQDADGKVRLDEHAELASVRRSIIFGSAR